MTTPGWSDKPTDHTAAGSGSGRGASPGRTAGCPSWSESLHEADDCEAMYHDRIVAWHDGATVALSHIVYHDPAETENTVIILDMGEADGLAELEETDAIRLLGVKDVVEATDSKQANDLNGAKFEDRM